MTKMVHPCFNAVRAMSFAACIASVSCMDVYWKSLPTLPGETLMIAGTFGNGTSDNQDVRVNVELCGSSSCSPMGNTSVDIWWHSIKAVLPATLSPQSFLRVSDTRSRSSLRVDINTPEIQWWMALSANGIPLSPSQTIPTDAKLRFFGRSIAWQSPSECIDARNRQKSQLTQIQLSPAGAKSEGYTVSAVNATCFEATFDLAEMYHLQPGVYDVLLLNLWGSSILQDITITIGPPKRSSEPFVLDVDHDFGGSIDAALSHAGQLNMTNIIVKLAPREYNVSTGMLIPNGTHVIGSTIGTAKTSVIFAKPPSPPNFSCSVPLKGKDLDFSGSNSGKDVGYINNVSSADECCNACSKNPTCNAFSLMIKEKECILKSCKLDTESKCTAVANPNGDRTSGFISPFRPSTGTTDAVFISTGPDDSGSHNWSVENLTIIIASAVSNFKAIHASGTGFSIRNVSMYLRQENASSAIIIRDATQFEVSKSVMVQENLCFWGPKLGMHDSATDFQDSATLQMYNGQYGHIHNNIIRWMCSAYDMDVSSNIAFEDNNITSTEAGILPHGNSVSAYGWSEHPQSSNWSFSHNVMSRPANNDPHNWAFHETYTSDGSGGWGAGVLASSAANGEVRLNFSLASSSSPVGASLVVVDGPGMGQVGLITAMDTASSKNQTSLVVSPPLDAAVNHGSKVAVVATIGSKIVAGNSFSWGMVVQWFGTTIRGVIADNDFTDMNVCKTGYDCKVGSGALEGFGLCYGQGQPLFFAEYTGNVLLRSNGIDLYDNSGGGNPECAVSYAGPYVRWQVLRRNSISGIAKSNTECGGISLHSNTISPSTDVLVEHNTFSCPVGKVLPGYNGLSVNCSHCYVRP